MDGTSFEEFRRRTTRAVPPAAIKKPQEPADLDSIVKRSENMLKNFKPPGKGK